MALNFEKTLVVSSNQGATQSFLGQEHNGNLYKYYTTDGVIGTVVPRIVTEAVDQYTPIVLANYNHINWSEVSKSLTSDYVDTIGIKTFPGIGAYGFWTLQGEARSKVLAPIHVNRTYTTPPTYTYTVTDNNVVSFVISQPKDISYECFRVILKEENFTLEYVTYDLEFDITPAYRGTYIMYIVGYIGEGSIVSEDSAQSILYISNGAEYSPSPCLDKYVDSIEYVSNGTLKIHRSDNVNFTVPPYLDKNIERASFSDDGTLTLTTRDNTTIRATNYMNKIESTNFTQGGKLSMNFKDGSSLISTNGAGEPDIDVFTDEEKNLSTYSIVKPDSAVITVNYSNNINDIYYKPAEGREHLYHSFSVNPHTDYVLTFMYRTASGFTCEGALAQTFAVTTRAPVDSWYDSIIGESEALNNLVTAEFTKYSITFNSGSYSTVYFIADLEFIANDRPFVELLISDICLYNLTTDNSINNFASRISDISFAANGKLNIMFKDGSAITSTNAAPSGGTKYVPAVINTYWAESTGNYSYTYSYTGTAGNLLVLCLMIRSELTTSPAGWTRLGVISQKEPDSDYSQRVYVFYKTASGNTEQISYGMDRPLRTILGLLEIKHANSVSLDERTRQEDIIFNDYITCTRPDADDEVLYIWLATIEYYSNNAYPWEVSDSNIWQLPDNGTIIPRLAAFIESRVAVSSFTIGTHDVNGKHASCIGLRVE